MKRVMAVLFVVAFAFTMVSGCASNQKVKDCPEPCLERIQTLETRTQADMRPLDAAVAKAEAAARRAEACADKCEAAFMKRMKK